MHQAYRRGLAPLFAAALMFQASGCQTLNTNKEKGAVIGAAGGAVAGAVIGKATGSTARGAIIGAAVGGTAGAIIGHQMDQKAKEIMASVPGATVTRVGEGLVVTFESGLLFDFDSDQLRSEARFIDEHRNEREVGDELRQHPLDRDGAGESDRSEEATEMNRRHPTGCDLVVEGVPARHHGAIAGRFTLEPHAR